MGNLKLRQLSILLRIAGGIISFVLLTDQARKNVETIKEISYGKKY